MQRILQLSRYAVFIAAIELVHLPALVHQLGSVTLTTQLAAPVVVGRSVHMPLAVLDAPSKTWSEPQVGCCVHVPLAVGDAPLRYWLGPQVGCCVHVPLAVGDAPLMYWLDLQVGCFVQLNPLMVPPHEPVRNSPPGHWRFEQALHR